MVAASELNLPEWCIAAGFVRNFVWDVLHGYKSTTPLADIDLIYFDSSDIAAERDLDLEDRLAKIMSGPWSVKNQARMNKKMVMQSMPRR